MLSRKSNLHEDQSEITHAHQPNRIR